MVGQPWVLVRAMDGEPLGLAHPAQVRIWVRKGKATVRRTGVNVVQMTCAHAQATFERKSRALRADIGVDPGAKTSGLALVIDGRVLWMAEVHHRSGSITLRMTQRRQCRSARRCRRKEETGRGRKPARWRHRAKKAGWLPPSVYHRVQSLRRWTGVLVEFATPMVERNERPVVDGVSVHVETSPFDIHKVVNPEVEGVGYQQGPLWEANLRGYVITRDGGRCVYCGARDGGPRGFELDHVVAKIHGGSTDTGTG